MFVSSGRFTAALVLAEWLKLAIFPLQWCHIYAPVAPSKLALELLHCPAPYILGIHRRDITSTSSFTTSSYDDDAFIPSDVVVVDLDNNYIRLPEALQSILAQPSVKIQHFILMISEALQPHLFACDEVASAVSSGNKSYFLFARLISYFK